MMELRDEVMFRENVSDDIDTAISQMLKEYKNNEDDLLVLRGQCKQLLESNDTDFEKLEERGLKKIVDFLRGVRGRCKHRILYNHESILRITLEIEEKIILQLQDLKVQVADLAVELKEHKNHVYSCLNLVIQNMNDLSKKSMLNDWRDYHLQDYRSETDAKKILIIVSTIFNTDVRDYNYELDFMKHAIKELGLSEIIIHPISFADQILRVPECLPLYIKEGYNYNDAEVEISDYGAIIFQVYDSVNNQIIHKLAVRQNQDPITLCRELVEGLIEDRQIVGKPVIDICNQLLEDLRNLRLNFEQKRIEPSEIRGSEPETIPLKEAKEDQNEHLLAVLTAPFMLEYSLNNPIKIPLKYKGRFCLDKNEMEIVEREIDSFSPAIIAKSNGIDLYIRNKNIRIVSFADLCFCLWNQKREQDRTLDSNARYIALVDYYDKFLRVTCYSLDDAECISKIKPWINIKYNKLRKNIMETIYSEFFPDISKNKFNMDVLKKEIILYRLFETKQHVGDKLDVLEIPFIGRIWETLKDPDVLKYTVNLLDR